MSFKVLCIVDRIKGCYMDAASTHGSWRGFNAKWLSYPVSLFRESTAPWEVHDLDNDSKFNSCSLCFFNNLFLFYNHIVALSMKITNCNIDNL